MTSGVTMSFQMNDLIKTSKEREGSAHEMCIAQIPVHTSEFKVQLPIAPPCVNHRQITYETGLQWDHQKHLLNKF